MRSSACRTTLHHACLSPHPTGGLPKSHQQSQLTQHTPPCLLPHGHSMLPSDPLRHHRPRALKLAQLQEPQLVERLRLEPQLVERKRLELLLLLGLRPPLHMACKRYPASERKRSTAFQIARRCALPYLLPRQFQSTHHLQSQPCPHVAQLQKCPSMPPWRPQQCQSLMLKMQPALEVKSPLERLLLPQGRKADRILHTWVDRRSSSA
mmetsp:Transcript_35334/g.80886  ORF Transcript_35334/g.80886 Transcript_35334/m.80886 type:complete len:208 (-) Transcript_35334:507-1130(-)